MQQITTATTINRDPAAAEEINTIRNTDTGEEGDRVVMSKERH